MTHAGFLQFSFASISSWSISSCRVPLGLKIHWFTSGQEDLGGYLGCGLFSSRGKGPKERREKKSSCNKDLHTGCSRLKSLSHNPKCLKPSQMAACCLILVIYLSWLTKQALGASVFHRCSFFLSPQVNGLLKFSCSNMLAHEFPSSQEFLRNSHGEQLLFDTRPLPLSWVLNACFLPGILAKTCWAHKHQLYRVLPRLLSGTVHLYCLIEVSHSWLIIPWALPCSVRWMSSSFTTHCCGLEPSYFIKMLPSAFYENIPDHKDESRVIPFSISF